MDNGIYILMGQESEKRKKKKKQKRPTHTKREKKKKENSIFPFQKSPRIFQILGKLRGKISTLNFL